MTWVGYTNTFLVAIANLLTAVATLVYVLRNRKETRQQVDAIKSVVEDSAAIPIVKGPKHGLRE
jgi:hypothetical protein